MADPFSLFLSQSFSPPYHVEERESRGKEAEQPCRAARRAEQRDDHHQPRSALACHVLLDADAKHTQYHTSPTSLPPRHPLHLLITAFPFPLSRCDTTTKKVSAPPCSRASTHAMAAMGDGVVGVGRGSNRREEKRKHNISLTHTCTTCCLCVQVWHAGGGGHELLVVRNTSSGAAAAAAAAFPLCTGTCIG